MSAAATSYFASLRVSPNGVLTLPRRGQQTMARDGIIGLAAATLFVLAVFGALAYKGEGAGRHVSTLLAMVEAGPATWGADTPIQRPPSVTSDASNMAGASAPLDRALAQAPASPSPKIEANVAPKDSSKSANPQPAPWSAPPGKAAPVTIPPAAVFAPPPPAIVRKDQNTIPNPLVPIPAKPMIPAQTPNTQVTSNNTVARATLRAVNSLPEPPASLPRRFMNAPANVDITPSQPTAISPPPPPVAPTAPVAANALVEKTLPMAPAGIVQAPSKPTTAPLANPFVIPIQNMPTQNIPTQKVVPTDSKSLSANTSPRASATAKVLSTGHTTGAAISATSADPKEQKTKPAHAQAVINAAPVSIVTDTKSKSETPKVIAPVPTQVAAAVATGDKKNSITPKKVSTNMPEDPARSTVVENAVSDKTRVNTPEFSSPTPAVNKLVDQVPKVMVENVGIQPTPPVVPTKKSVNETPNAKVQKNEIAATAPPGNAPTPTPTFSPRNLATENAKEETLATKPAAPAPSILGNNRPAPTEKWMVDADAKAQVAESANAKPAPVTPVKEFVKSPVSVPSRESTAVLARPETKEIPKTASLPNTVEVSTLPEAKVSPSPRANPDETQLGASDSTANSRKPADPPPVALAEMVPLGSTEYARPPAPGRILAKGVSATPRENEANAPQRPTARLRLETSRPEEAPALLTLDEPTQVLPRPVLATSVPAMANEIAMDRAKNTVDQRRRVIPAARPIAVAMAPPRTLRAGDDAYSRSNNPAPTTFTDERGPVVLGSPRATIAKQGDPTLFTNKISPSAKDENDLDAPDRDLDAPDRDLGDADTPRETLPMIRLAVPTVTTKGSAQPLGPSKVIAKSMAMPRLEGEFNDALEQNSPITPTNIVSQKRIAATPDPDPTPDPAPYTTAQTITPGKIAARSVPVTLVANKEEPDPPDLSRPVVPEYEPIGRAQDGDYESVAQAAPVHHEVYVPIRRENRSGNDFYLASNSTNEGNNTDTTALDGTDAEIADIPVTTFSIASYYALEGDSFANIAREKYGSANLGEALAFFNRSRLGAEEQIPPGSRLRLPPMNQLRREAEILAARRPRSRSAPIAPDRNEVARRENQRPTSTVTPMLINASASGARNNFTGSRDTPEKSGNSSANTNFLEKSASVDRDASRNTVAGSIRNSNSNAASTPDNNLPYKTYKVQRNNETLWGVARRTLGDGKRQQEILTLNRYQLESELTTLKPGTILRLPPDAKITP